ncbi:hypothetical protein F4810DRAFT_657881 [Camillea tinctor]|nr:hypothetical protein F4810DRAFT_657881 [Camillea tinctor]
MPKCRSFFSFFLLFSSVRARATVQIFNQTNLYLGTFSQIPFLCLSVYMISLPVSRIVATIPIWNHTSTVKDNIPISYQNEHMLYLVCGEAKQFGMSVVKK